MQYVIPAAGKGSRFIEAGFQKPKPLIELHGIPLIAWVIANFSYNKNDSINIVVRKNEFNTLYLEKYLTALPIKPKFIFLEEVTDGAARTVFYATKNLNLDQPMIVANSDQYVSENLNNYIEHASSTDSDGCILTMKASSNKWSYISVDSNDLIEQVVEKQQISNEATVGVYSWRRVDQFISSFEQMIAADDRVNGEFYLAPTYNYLIKEGKKISYLNIGEIDLDVHGLGTPKDFAKFESNPKSNIHAQLIKKKFNIEI